MSEEKAISEAFEGYEEAEETAEIVEEVEDKPEYSALELEAREDGHTTKDEWTEAGKDPERWKSPHEYVEYGKIKSALDKSKADNDRRSEEYDKRFENLNKLHKAETDSKIKALKAEQRQAVEEADTDAYDKAQTQIEELKVEPIPPNQDALTSPPPEIAAWEAKNPWINDAADPKAQAAQGLFNGYTKANPNATAKQALDYVDSQMETMGVKQVPTNPRRDAPNETTRAPASPRNTGKISMSDLTTQERADFNNMGSALWSDGNGGVDTKAFLQAVKDSRKGL